MGKFTIKCNNCGDMNPPLDDDHTSVKIYFEKGSDAIMDRMVYYCANCGNKQEFGISWPVDVAAIKAQPAQVSDAKV